MSARRQAVRVVLYARLSKDEGGTRDGNERQEADMRAEVERANRDSRGPRREVVAVLHDRSISADGEALRPSFERGLAMLEGNEADELWVNALDRFTRAPAELERMIRLVEFYGVAVATVVQGDLRLDTPEGREMARYQVVRARSELEQTSRRQKNKARHNAEAGLAHGRQLFGYMQGATKGSRVKDPAAAPVVSEVFTRLAGGESAHAVLRWLNAEHPRAERVSPTTGERFGGRWTTQLLRAMASNEAYTGVRVHCSLEADKRRTGRKVYVEQGRVEGAWPALVSAADFAAVQASFASRARGAKPPRRYVLTGVMRCAACGGHMNGAPYTSTSGKAKTRYVCARSTSGAKVCQTIDGAGAEDKVLTFLFDYLASEWAGISAPAAASPLDAQIADLEAVIAAKRERLDMARTAKQEDELAASIERLDAQLAKLTAQRPAPKVLPAAVARIAAADDPRLEWHALDRDVAQQAAIVRALLDVECSPPVPGAPKAYDGSRVRVRAAAVPD